MDRLVVRVGDPWIMIDGTSYPPRQGEERKVADQRARFLDDMLCQGVEIEELRTRDLGRERIMEELKRLHSLRNQADGRGYGAIDGSPVPATYIEFIELPDRECEVVLATDGYPVIASTLFDTELLLAERIARDPLMIGDPAQTKGVEVGAQSYDDRTYVRCRVSARA